MVHSKLVMAVLVVLMAAQAAQGARNLLTTCKYTKCPSGYVPATVPNVDMCPLCVRPANLPCASTFKDYVKYGPFCCGGSSGILCPSVACAYSASYSISGSGSSCAVAKSTVQAFAFSNATYDFKSLYTPVFKDYCYKPTTQAISAFVSSLVSAYSDAVARTLIQYNTYVCECPTKCWPGSTGYCKDDSEAYTVVAADVQAVARAQAEALQVALAEVYDNCWYKDPQLLASAAAVARSVASDVALAVDGLYKTGVSSSTSALNCKKQVTFNRTKEAVATAVACSYVKLFALARDSCTAGTTYACSSTVAVAGTSPDFKGCELAVECVPKYYPIVDGSCKLGDEILADLEFDPALTSPVPSAYEVPAPTDDNPLATATVFPSEGDTLTALEFKYAEDQNPSVVGLSQTVQVYKAGSSWNSVWCGRTPLVYYTDANSITFDLPADTTAFITTLMANYYTGSYTFSAVASDGTIITDPTFVVEPTIVGGDSPVKYVGFYVKSWFLKSVTITAPAESFGFAFADTYISNTVIPSEISSI